MLLTWRDNRNNKQDNYIYYRKEGQVKLTSLWSRTKEYEKEAQVRPDEEKNWIYITEGEGEFLFQLSWLWLIVNLSSSINSFSDSDEPIHTRSLIQIALPSERVKEGQEKE